MSLELAPLDFNTSKPLLSASSDPREDTLTLYFTPGRLGNQLYELATAAAHAWKHKKKLIIPKNFLNDPQHYNVFQIFKIAKSYLASTPPSNKPHLYQEKSFAYQPLPKLKHMAIRGYFQSWKYFHHARHQLLESISFPSWTKDLKARYEQVLKKPCISLHVRRGDYKDHGFYLLGDDYYQKALKHMPKETHLMVFSDDLEEAKKLPSLNNHPHVTFVDEGTFESLYLMTQCTHHIIANSSFSWWGAYLSQNGEGKSAIGSVICPKKWFKPHPFFKIHPPDLFLPHWKCL